MFLPNDTTTTMEIKENSPNSSFKRQTIVHKSNLLDDHLTRQYLN